MSRILIIEDEEAIADLEKDYLELSGFEVEICNRGDTGLTRALNEEFDLIILDLMLPGIDGYQVCREIRKSNNVPIIMLSAKGETFDKVLGLELGADDYIIKPFETKELVALDVILPLAKQLLQEVDYEHHPIRLIGLSVSNPREEEEKGVWEQLSFEFSDWETDHSNK